MDVCVSTSTILSPAYNKITLFLGWLQFWVPMELKEVYRSISIFLTLFSKGLNNQNKKSGASYYTTGCSGSRKLVSCLRKSEKIQQLWQIGIAFLLCLYLIDHLPKKGEINEYNIQNSHKICLSSEIMQRNLLSEKGRQELGHENIKERKQKIQVQS